MNAYTLADELDSKWIRGSHKAQAANLLREQAEHINNLDILLDKKYEIIKKQSKQINQMEQECAAMREQLKHLESQVYGGITK